MTEQDREEIIACIWAISTLLGALGLAMIAGNVICSYTSATIGWGSGILAFNFTIIMSAVKYFAFNRTP